MPVVFSPAVAVESSQHRSVWRRYRFVVLAPLAFGVGLGLLEVAGSPAPSLLMLLGFALTAALIAVLIGLLMLPFAWRRGCRTLAWGVILFGSSILGGHAHNAARMSTFAACAENAKPLIAAIERYREEHNEAPPSLKRLVPEYLDRIPGTGLSRYPTWDYGEAPGEPYELVVHCSFFMSFDAFVYWPSGRCPARNYGGSPERIGAWVYVHE